MFKSRYIGLTSNFLKNNKLLLILVFLIALFIITGPPWLCVGLLVIGLVHRLLTTLKRQRIIYTALLLLELMLFAIALRVFVFEIYTIPSESMENTLDIGDHILVNKLQYGPRLPKSWNEIPWLNMIAYLIEKKGKTNECVWPDHRLAGYSEPKSGDVVVFRKPDDPNEFLVKRCVGLPGEKIEILDGTTVINGRPVADLSTVKHLYKIYINHMHEFVQFARGNHLLYELVTGIGAESHAVLFLDSKQKAKIIAMHLSDSVVTYRADIPVYPYNDSISWYPYKYGPLLIPVKGTKIKLSHRNWLIYGPAILREQATLPQSQRLCATDSLQEYIFTRNYYFVLGDNRDNSNDSRFLGLVPDNNIEGKVILKFFAKRGGTAGSWSRFMTIF